MYDIFATGRWVNWSSFRFVSSNFIYTCIIFYPCYGMVQVGIVFEVRYEFSYFMDNLIKCKWFMFGTDKSKYSNKTGKGTAILLLHVRVDNSFPIHYFIKCCWPSIRISLLVILYYFLSREVDIIVFVLYTLYIRI